MRVANPVVLIPKRLVNHPLYGIPFKEILDPVAKLIEYDRREMERLKEILPEAIGAVSGFFAREESWPFIRTDSHLKDVKDINQQINLKEHVGRNLGKNLIRICPVNAINYSHQLEEPIKIEEKLER